MLKEIKKFYNRTIFKFRKEELSKEVQYPLNWVKIFFKTYPRFPKTKINQTFKKGELCSLLNKRESKRDFVNHPLDKSKIDNILYFSLGIKDYNVDFNKTKRFYPSAGGRYPLESYLISNNINNLEKGLYHYSVKNNVLETLLRKDLKEKSKDIFGEYLSENNPNFLILTGVMSRSEIKYKVNAYRFALIESGHVGQNISLLSEKYNLGCCPIGGFDNKKISKLIDLSEDEIPLYCFAIGEVDK